MDDIPDLSDLSGKMIQRQHKNIPKVLFKLTVFVLSGGRGGRRCCKYYRILKLICNHKNTVYLGSKML